MTEIARDPSRFAALGPRRVESTRKLGEQTVFYGQSLAAIADAIRRYPGESCCG